MSNMKCAFSQVDITPPTDLGIFQDGYGSRTKPADSVRDPIYAKICIFKTSEGRLVLVSVDCCGFNHKMAQRIRDSLCGLCRLEEKELALCATHTHAGPVGGVLGLLPINGYYWNDVIYRLSEAILASQKELKPCTLRFGFGKELEGIYNRRGKQDIDRRVKVGAFFDENNKLLGAITTASCHAVCIGDMGFSADYPAILTKKAAELYPDAPFLFLQGRSGDVDPLDIGKTDSVELYNKLGEEFGASVLGAVEELKNKKSSLSGSKLKASFKICRLPMRRLDDQYHKERLEYSYRRLAVADTPDKKRFKQVDLVWHSAELIRNKRDPEPSIEVNLQTLLLGDDAAFVFVPFEMLTKTGNTLEKILCSMGIAPEKAMVFGHSNGTNGYLAPSDEVSENTYETQSSSIWYDLPCCSEKTETEMIAQLEKMLK